MASFQCQPGSLASTVCCCLCCFMFIYKPASIAITYSKSPQIIGALCLACCCMSSQTATLGSCAYNAVVPEKKDE